VTSLPLRVIVLLDVPVSVSVEASVWFVNVSVKVELPFVVSVSL
jgi:hypothetical protein